MRRIVWLTALLYGFSGDHYIWTVRSREPAPMVQPVRLREPSGTMRGPAWWRA